MNKKKGLENRAATRASEEVSYRPASLNEYRTL